jgi:heme/copper-type cytochrome/quinol oxidase subunit 2
MSWHRSGKTLWCVLMLLVLALPTAGHACPGCKDALAASNNAHKTPFDADPAATAEMFSWTVFMMLGTVAGIFAGFAGSFYWMVRRAAAKQAAPSLSGESCSELAGSSPEAAVGAPPVHPTNA